METADVIVIGSGQGGVPLAADFAKAGNPHSAPTTVTRMAVAALIGGLTEQLTV
jgi:pyruvate/2-oxoglutarate dehydrogenase complex dihydrolipoamide dehydrogenase (E3) component